MMGVVGLWRLRVLLLVGACSGNDCMLRSSKDAVFPG